MNSSINFSLNSFFSLVLSIKGFINKLISGQFLLLVSGLVFAYIFSPFIGYVLVAIASSLIITTTISIALTSLIVFKVIYFSRNKNILLENIQLDERTLFNNFFVSYFEFFKWLLPITGMGFINSINHFNLQITLVAYLIILVILFLFSLNKVLYTCFNIYLALLRFNTFLNQLTFSWAKMRINTQSSTNNSSSIFTFKSFISLAFARRNYSSSANNTSNLTTANGKSNSNTTTISTVISPTSLTLQNQNTPNSLILKLPSGKRFFINKLFIEWLVGFVDAEGNFYIGLRDFNGTYFSSIVLTFQIGLHIDDHKVLEFIQKKLHCGNISCSGKKCNFYVSDKEDLFNIIIPLFNSRLLNSTKYFQFLNFRDAAAIVQNKEHHSAVGVAELIKLRLANKDILAKPKSDGTINRTNVNITKYWLVGFIEGDATFSVVGRKSPRLKFENHHKEHDLFLKIAAFFKAGTVLNNKPRPNRPTHSPTVSLDYREIVFLKTVVAVILTSEENHVKLFNTKKARDFEDWLKLLDIFYFGYHTLPEGMALVNKITSNWNNFRLSTYKSKVTSNTSSDLLDTSLVANIDQQVETVEPQDEDYSKEFKRLLTIPSPYIIKDGIRLTRDKLSLVSGDKRLIEATQISTGQTFVFDNVTNCASALRLDRHSITKNLFSDEVYKGYKFRVSPNLYK